MLEIFTAAILIAGAQGASDPIPGPIFDRIKGRYTAMLATSTAVDPQAAAEYTPASDLVPLSRQEEQFGRYPRILLRDGFITFDPETGELLHGRLATQTPEAGTSALDFGELERRAVLYATALWPRHQHWIRLSFEIRHEGADFVLSPRMNDVLSNESFFLSLDPFRGILKEFVGPPPLQYDLERRPLFVSQDGLVEKILPAIEETFLHGYFTVDRSELVRGVPGSYHNFRWSLPREYLYESPSLAKIQQERVARWMYRLTLAPGVANSVMTVWVDAVSGECLAATNSSPYPHSYALSFDFLSPADAISGRLVGAKSHQVVNLDRVPSGGMVRMGNPRSFWMEIDRHYVRLCLITDELAVPINLGRSLSALYHVYAVRPEYQDLVRSLARPFETNLPSGNQRLLSLNSGPQEIPSLPVIGYPRREAALRVAEKTEAISRRLLEGRKTNFVPGPITVRSDETNSSREFSTVECTNGAWSRIRVGFSRESDREPKSVWVDQIAMTSTTHLLPEAQIIPIATEYIRAVYPHSGAIDVSWIVIRSSGYQVYFDLTMEEGREPQPMVICLDAATGRIQNINFWTRLKT